MALLYSQHYGSNLPASRICRRPLGWVNLRGDEMKLRILTILAVVVSGVGMTVVYQAAASLDGTKPPHAVDTAGKAIPESSATKPDKPFIQLKDSADPKWGELMAEKALYLSKLL